MGVAQYFLATNGLWTLGATGGAIAGLLVGLVLVRLPAFRAKAEDAPVEPLTVEDEGKSLWLSLLAYGLLVVLAFSINLIPPVDGFLSQVKLTLDFPELTTTLGWVTAAGSGREINIFGHPGAILLYTSIISYIIYRKAGYIQKGALKGILGRVVKSGVNSSLGIVAMVGLASIMLHSGMTYLLAKGLSAGIGPKVFPIVSPFIGALGAFITGSNNNSNVPVRRIADEYR